MLYNGVMSEMPESEKDGMIKMEKDMSCGEGPEERFFLSIFFNISVFKLKINVKNSSVRHL